MTSAVVFAYHDVGCRCLSVLLAHGVRVALVLTHDDDPAETIWFGSVRSLAEEHDIPVISPADPNAGDIVARIAALSPEFLFSFYYRRMLGPRLLSIPARGAYNLHGSLLPKYRGRAPVNWAILKGERQTGATLHRMVEKPDAGAIYAQRAVPILPEDSALEVFRKVTVAAELALDEVLPRLIGGTARGVEQDLSRGSYFGGRRPEDGRIDWSLPARRIHDLVRAVAPPYPGAFCDLPGGRLRVLRTLAPGGETGSHPRPMLYLDHSRLFARCGDGRILRILAAEWNGRRIDCERLPEGLRELPLPLIPDSCPT
ncbi:MAG: formyltransferase [Rhodocyclaceae bacterium]